MCAGLFTDVDPWSHQSLGLGNDRQHPETTLIQDPGTPEPGTARPDVSVEDYGLCCPSLVGAPLEEADAAELAELLAALADPVRLRLLSLVAARVEICSCELEAPLGKSQPTVSHHTKVLARAGLLVGEKRGRWVWWRVEPSRLAAVRRALGA
jgi:ArsR family transcriptional regulator, arsenate/arsenite/antimonite-responsive transcriptional repressor